MKILLTLIASLVASAAFAQVQEPAKTLDGYWTGRVACGEMKMMGATGSSGAATSRPISFSIKGDALLFTYESKNMHEKWEGKISGNVVEITGIGSRLDVQGYWTIKGTGNFTGTTLEGKSTVYGTRGVLRDCTFKVEKE